MNLWQTIAGIFTDAVSGSKVAAPLVGPLTLEQLIDKVNQPFYSPISGGTIHRLSYADIARNATIIREAVKKLNSHRVRVAEVAGLIGGESRFDHLCFNPNNNARGASRTDSPYAVYLRTDYGIAQVDGRYMGALDGMKGLSWPDQIQKAYDPNWAIPQLASRLDELLAWSADLCARSLPLLHAGEGDSRVVGLNAYNAGESGTIVAAAFNPPRPLTYGKNAVARIDLYRSVLAGDDAL